MAGRRFRYVEPADETFAPLIIEVTEDDLLRDFYPRWAEGMQRVGKLLMATPENCIDDYVVVHWCWEVTDAA
jgi:hypothetical protein